MACLLIHMINAAHVDHSSLSQTTCQILGLIWVKLATESKWTTVLQTSSCISPYLLKQPQTVCVVIVGEIDDTRLAAVHAKGVPEPPQSQVPLYSAPRYSWVFSIPTHLIVPWCLHIEVSVVESCLMEEMADQSCSPL